MFNPCRNKMIPPFQLLAPKNQWTVNTSYQPRLFIPRPAMFSTNVPKQLTEKCHSLENVLKVNEITMEQFDIDDFTEKKKPKSKRTVKKKSEDLEIDKLEVTTMSIEEKKPKLSKTKKSETDNEKKVSTPKKRRTISSYKEENDFLKKQIEDIYAKLDNIEVKLIEDNVPVSSQKPEEPNNTFESEQSKIGDSIAESSELNHHTSGQEKLTSTNSDITNLDKKKKVISNDKKKKKIKTKENNSKMSDDLSDLNFKATPIWAFDPIVSPLLSYAGSRQGLWTRKPYYYYDFMIMNSFAIDTLAIYISHMIKSSG